MRYRSHPFKAMLLIGLYVLLSATFALAQDVPAPQFLYRDENHLVLLNGYTGEATELPLVVTDGDYFTWSPDGRYLLALLDEPKTPGMDYCLNLYDVDVQKWLYDKPISCAVSDVIFSRDNKQLFYASEIDSNGVLWIYNLNDKKSRELYQTEGGDDFYRAGIGNLQWSPSMTYLTFGSSIEIMGGSLNSLVIMNVENEHFISLDARDSYNAYYNPIWSVDDRWLVMVLQETYVRTSDEGDVYLVNPETGNSYRVTYTPAAYETDIHWTDDGKIAFTEVTEQKLTFTLEQAMNVEAVPPDKIVTPEPFNYVNDRREGAMISPDPNLWAWRVVNSSGDTTTLSIGAISSFNRTEKFAVSIPGTYNVLMGWRPSDYPYPQR